MKIGLVLSRNHNEWTNEQTNQQTRVITIPPSGDNKQEQQRVAVGPENASVIIRQVSSDAAALHVRFATAT